MRPPIPKTLPSLRNSERTKFKRCLLAWWWAYRQGLVKQGPPNINLWFGEGIHLALAEWYGPGGFERGRDPRLTWRDFAAEEVRFIKAEFPRGFDMTEYVEAGPFGEELLAGYLEHWGRDESWEFLAVEHPFEILVPGADGAPVARLFGTLDGVFRDWEEGRAVKVLETKTAKQIMTAHLALDDQRGTYFTVATQVLRERGLIKPSDQVTEIVYNFLRKGKRDDRPRNADGQALNKDGTVSKTQPTPLFKRHGVMLSRSEMRRQVEKISAEVQAMDAYRSRQLPIFKTPTRDCSWDCDFYNMCLLDESNPEDVPDFKRAVYAVKDPYASYRKSTSE